MPEESRDVWGKQIEFILTLVGYAVGLGNLWRFPYLCFRNGGGAFLIPYVISLILLGIPIFALECAFGQFGGKGPLSIWSINPLFKGLGVSMVTISCFTFVYYNVVIAIAIRFFVASMTSDLPWVDCKSCDCVLYGVNLSDTTLVEQLKVDNAYNLSCPNATSDVRSPSEIYYFDEILSDTGTMEEIGEVRWELVLCNLAAYTVIFLVLIKGISSLGKVVYFTATFPYIILTVLLVRVAMLDGAKDGVEYYLKPDWDKMTDGRVWSDAATQIFFSLSSCMGGLVAMASYNRFNNNIIRDAFTIPVINCLTSLFAGFVVFCTLGHMAHLKHSSVDNVTTQGTGLVFVTYPEVLAEMPVSTLWSVLFFFMLCILGFSSQFSGAETIMTSIIDEFPGVFDNKKKQIGLRLVICLLGFVLGIPMCTEGGQDLLNLVVDAVVGFPMLFAGLFEIVVIIHIYGYNHFAEDIKTMVGFKPFFYFKLTWCVVSPVLLVGVITFKAYEMEDFTPAWKGLIYYLIVVFIIMWIPVGYLYYGRHALKQAMAPEPYWLQRRKTNVNKTSADDMDRNGLKMETISEMSERKVAQINHGYMENEVRTAM